MQKEEAISTANWALYLLKNYSALSLNQIGELFNMDYAAVSQVVRRFGNKTKKNKDSIRDEKHNDNNAKTEGKC